MAHTPFQKIDTLINVWRKQLNLSADMRDWARLERLMLQVLPPQWQTRAVSAGIDDGVWTLCVRNSVDAHQLRFMAQELAQRLAEQLPYAPKIKVQVNPGLWTQRSATILPPATLYQQRYSDADADATLSAWQKNPTLK